MVVTYLHVRARTENLVQARLHIGHLVFPCLIGRNGRRHLKREGDGASPVGVFELTTGFYRRDRVTKPRIPMKTRPLRPSDGWCEVPGSGFYNRHVKLPFRDGHETMWRDDAAYDIVFATNHNARPRVQGQGSAIFFHLTRKEGKATAGCVAVSLKDMQKILTLCGPRVKLVIWPGQGQL
jgi:L,D-peptidoglycan transpeptidase YkuD (ErfK/YbiS/YcfS/YnhG family)